MIKKRSEIYIFFPNGTMGMMGMMGMMVLDFQKFSAWDV
jgi:hypothetical protein